MIQLSAVMIGLIKQKYEGDENETNSRTDNKG